MRSSDERRIERLVLDVKAILAGYGRAHAAAIREESDPGLGAVRFDTEGGRSSDVSRPTERSAMRRRSEAATELEALLAEASGLVWQLASRVVALVPPKQLADGRRMCANRYGCPENKPHAKLGLCAACWAFRDAHDGRDRTEADVAEQLRRQRAAATRRKAEARARGVQS